MEDANENGEGGHHDDMHIDDEFSNGEESSDEDESFDEDDSSVEDESSKEDRLEALWRQVDDNDPNLLGIQIGYTYDDLPDFIDWTLWRQVDENPSLLDIHIGYNQDDRPGFIDWYWHRFGAIIGRNTHLEALAIDIDHLDSPSQGRLNFFDGLALNRSIKKLSLIGRFDFDQSELIFPMLLPFFQNNRSFECLRILFKGDLHGRYHSLASTLIRFDSLKEFHLQENSTNWDPVVLEALHFHAGLEKLTLANEQLGGRGLQALARLLQNPRSNLTMLGLRRSGIDDEGAYILARGLNGNEKLKDVDLGDNPDITESGWRAIFAGLQMPIFGLEKLRLRGSNISDGTALALASAVRHNHTLKTLDFRDAAVITSSGRDGASIIANAAWRDLFAGLLQYPTCMLESLQLANCDGLNDDHLQFLTNALAHNCTLRQLVVGSNHGVTAAGWEAFSTVLQNPTSALEELKLSNSSINDHALISISNALVNNDYTRLKYLGLKENTDVTPIGWDALSTVLLHPSSALEELDVSQNSINDHNMISFVNALAGNRSLIKMNLSDNNDVTATGWDAFDNLLCNTSSIMSTYHSNHTLEVLDYWETFEQLGDIVLHTEYLLRINHNSSSISQAARLKIIMRHFSGSVNLQPFTAMHPSILPFAIAWMAKGDCVDFCDRDRLFSIFRSREYNLVYQFIRSMPTLLER